MILFYITLEVGHLLVSNTFSINRRFIEILK